MPFTSPKPSQFVRSDLEHQTIAVQLFPCARLLWDWLLTCHKPGTLIEVDLVDFATWTATARSQPYSLKQIQRGFLHLLDKALIEVDQKFTGTIYRLRAWVTPDKNVSSSPCMSSVSHGCPEQEPQTQAPHGVITDKTAIDNTLPVGSKDQESLDEVTKANEEPSTNEELIPRLIRRVVEPTKFVVDLAKSMFHKHGMAYVVSAIRAVEEQISRGGVKNCLHLLIAALREGYVPSKAASREDALVAERNVEFTQWYNSNQDILGLVASQQKDGDILVYYRDGQTAWFSNLMEGVTKI